MRCNIICNYYSHYTTFGYSCYYGKEKTHYSAQSRLSGRAVACYRRNCGSSSHQSAAASHRPTMIRTLPGEATVTIRKAGVVMTAEGHVYNSICTNPINTDKTLVGVLQESMRVPMRIHCKSVPQLRHALCLHVFLLTLSPKRNVFRYGSGSLQGGRGAETLRYATIFVGQ